MKYLISFSKDITKDFKSAKVSLEKIMDLVKSDYNYSAGTFKENYRNKENYENYSDLLILDIDEGLTIEQAKFEFMEFDYIIATTKSHQKEKNGKVCDRFRIIIPYESPMTLGSEDYSLMMSEIFKKYPFVDVACKDSSRFYYPSKDSIVFKHNGFCGFYWEDYYCEALKNIKLQDELKRIRLETFGKEKLSNENSLEYGNGEKIDYIRKIAKTEKLLELLKYDSKFVAGQRNRVLYSYGRYFQDLGMNEDEIRENIFWINNQGDSIAEDEIIKTIFKSLRV